MKVKMLMVDDEEEEEEMDYDPDAWRFREYAEGHTNDSPVDLSGREGAPREVDDEEDEDDECMVQFVPSEGDSQTDQGQVGVLSDLELTSPLAKGGEGYEEGDQG